MTAIVKFPLTIIRHKVVTLYCLNKIYFLAKSVILPYIEALVEARAVQRRYWGLPE